MRCRLCELTASQRRAVRLLIELSKRAGLVWDKYGRRSVRAQGMKGCMLGEISLVAFMQPGQYVKGAETSAVSDDVVIQHLRHVVDFLVKFDFDHFALSPWASDAERGICRKVDTQFRKHACVLLNCDRGNSLHITSKERIVELQRGFGEILRHLTAPAASAAAPLSYFQNLVSASQQYWDKVGSGSFAARTWLNSVAPDPSVAASSKSPPKPPPSSAPPPPAQARRRRAKARPRNIRGSVGRVAGPAPPPQRVVAALAEAEFVSLGPHLLPDGLSYTVAGTPVDQSKGILLYLTAAGGEMPFLREDGWKPKWRKRLENDAVRPTWNFFEGFTIVAPTHDTTKAGQRSKGWRMKPFGGGLGLAHQIRRHYPHAFYVLMGSSRGAWWAALWAAADEEAWVWDRAICVGGYRGAAGAAYRLCCFHSFRVCLFGVYSYVV